MKEKIAFIAVGQGGGNIGKLIESKGYKVLYLNTSQEDLDTLKDVKFKHHIKNGEGCNHDRLKAKKLVASDFEAIFEETEKLEADILMVIFATGGGTGSGGGPMLMDLLLGEGKTVGSIPILPGKDESVKAHMNSYECFKELLAIDDSGAMFPIDNNQGKKLTLNQKFVDPFCAFLNIPNQHKHIKGNIDKAEIVETLSAHGMAYVFQFDSKIAEAIEHFKNNIFAPAEMDGVVKYITLSAMDESLNLEPFEKVVGVPLDRFQTYNTKKSICCLSGLSFPKTRFDELYEKINTHKDNIVKNLNHNTEFRLDKDIDFLSGVTAAGSKRQEVVKTAESGAQKSKEEKRAVSRKSILDKYL